MALSNTLIQYTDERDGSANFTVSFADDDHKFSASAEGDTAIVEYEETLSWRGQLRVSEPDEHVFKELMSSDEMTEFLESYNLTSVRRER